MAIIQPTIQNTGDWTPPSDWIQLPAVANNEILLLVSDINPYYAFNVTVTGGYTVDWGDGVIDNWASGVNCTHTYTVGAGQVCSRGYTTFKVRIYAQIPANNITIVRIFFNNSIKNASSGVLWVKIGATKLTTLQRLLYPNPGVAQNNNYYVECIELPNSLTSCIDYSYIAYNCFSLQKVVMPYNYLTSDNINFSNAFYNCYSLKSIDYHASTLNVSTFASAHYNNYALKTVKLPDTVNGCTSWNSAFQSSGLKDLILPIINTDCTITQMVQSCGSLDTITYNSSWSNRITNCYSQTYGCTKISNLYNFPTILKSIGSSGAEMFDYLTLVKTINFPSITSGTITSLANEFTNDYNLETITNFPALNSVTVLTAAFQNCYKLKNIDNIDQLGDTTTGFDHTNTFAGCYSLTTISCRNKITGRFILKGIDASNKAALSSLRFTNAASTFAGASPQIDIRWTSLDRAALVQVFNDLPTLTGKTISCSGSVGYADLTPADIAIANVKGWTVS